jgi:L-ribulose-5-phosphate 4-epimerase
MSDFNDLKERVCEANLALVKHGLVVMTWGNVSEVDRERGIVVIKPSGVAYDVMKPEHMVVMDLNGNRIEGELNPSSDTPTHLELYRAFQDIGGITHTHSANATAFSQAHTEIPCFGTTHADHFFGTVPVTRSLTEAEVLESYEANTGKVIVECFNDNDLKPHAMPAVLVASHAPFTWGKSAMDSVKNSVALEEVAKMALAVRTLSPQQSPVDDYLLCKHYNRKHGENAYYGQ